MTTTRPYRLQVLAALTAALALPPALADKVASPEEIRALRDKLAKSPPKPADYWAQPYPGAIFDAECSARGAAPRMPDFAVYCFYTRDPADKVRAFLAADGKPRNAGVDVRVDEHAQVTFNSYVKVSDVTRITYWFKPSTVAYYEGFPTSPPSAEELLAPLPADARYDRDCSAAQTLSARREPQRWRGVWCYQVATPVDVASKSFSSDLRFTRKHGVQVELKAVSGATPATQIQYWLTTAPPEVPAAAATPQPVAAPSPQAGTSTAAPAAAAAKPPASAAPPQQTTAAAPANPKPPAQGASAPPNRPPSPAQDAAARAVETVNKLRGLFGR